MLQPRTKPPDEVESGIHQLAQASQVPVALVANELLGEGANGQNGNVVVEVHHIHETRPNPEFRAKLIKGQRGSYGFELTVSDSDLSAVIRQMEKFEQEMLKQYGNEEEQRALKVRKDVEDLYGRER